MFLVLLEAGFLICAVAAVPFVVYLDAVIFGNTIDESSITEYLHNALLGVSIGAFGVGAVKYPLKRGYLIACTTFFSCLFIRELDSTFDKIQQGFWLYPAVIVLAAGACLMIKNRGMISRSFLVHFDTRAGGFVLIGLVLLIVFTRLFGTGSLWEPIMAADYSARYKSIIQEGMELMSYTIIAYGSCLSLASGFGATSPALPRKSKAA